MHKNKTRCEVVLTISASTTLPTTMRLMPRFEPKCESGLTPNSNPL